MFSVGTNFLDNELRWNAQFKSEDEKNRLKFTGKGPDLSKIEGTAGIFSGDYNLNTDKYNLGVNYPITDNISFKSGYDSDDVWDAGIYGKWTWGQPERQEQAPRKEQTETERLLRLNLNKLKTRLNESKGGRVGMGKGGLAKILGV